MCLNFSQNDPFPQLACEISLRAKARLEATYIFLIDSANLTICMEHNPGRRKTLWVAGCQSDLFCHYLLSLVPCSQQRREKHYNAQCKDLLLAVSLKMGTNIIKCYCIRWRSRDICRMLYNLPINMFKHQCASIFIVRSHLYFWS